MNVLYKVYVFGPACRRHTYLVTVAPQSDKEAEAKSAVDHVVGIVCSHTNPRTTPDQWRNYNSPVCETLDTICEEA